MRTGAETYERESWAERALTLVEAQLVTGEWTDPSGGKVGLRTYAERWIAHHASLRPRTVELYSWLLAAHIVPYLGALPVGSITPGTVREWRAGLLSSGVSQTTTAKAYRLLRAVLMTATEDRLIPRNPCRIRGGGDEKPAERPVLTIAQVFDLADQLAAHRYRALILLTTFASLRWGEAIALRRCDLDLTARTVTIRRQYVEANGSLMIAPPKSRAGVRAVAFPATLVPELRQHLDTMSDPTMPRSCSLASAAACLGVATSAAIPAGLMPQLRPGCRTCIFMICGIPGTRWRRRPESAWRTLRRAWDMTACGPR